ncbi:MAG: hypothetical protein HY423_11125 [Candidatus Lambdaproteobacteria bacterium]|nr:hypothetical protein [Candidatus Lambdaproteobacteria bacterium]
MQLARWRRIDPEAALRRAVRKFIGRFEHMERRCRAEGVPAAGRSAEAWWRLWEEAKRAEQAGQAGQAAPGDGT